MPGAMSSAQGTPRLSEDLTTASSPTPPSTLPPDHPVVENGGDNYLLFRMRFDGTCEIDGVEYHRLRYTGNVVKWAFSYEGDLFGYEETTNDNPQEYLMREEDGKVYVFNIFNSRKLRGILRFWTMTST